MIMEWISVDERLPEIDEFVLWCTEAKNMFVCEIDKDDDGSAFDRRPHGGTITHWMPLPEPPTQGA